MAIVRLLVFGFLILSVIYVSLVLYARARQRDRLRAVWEERGRIGDRDAFVRAGLAEYEGSFRKRLLLGVYVIPAVLIGLVVYLVNYT